MHGFAYFFLLCGFLTYEIILTILFFTAFYLTYSNFKNLLNIGLVIFLKYIFPVIMTLMLVSTWHLGALPKS
jgi:hypothetical protein